MGRGTTVPGRQRDRKTVRRGPQVLSKKGCPTQLTGVGCRSRLQDVSLAPNRSRVGQRGRPPLRERAGVDDDCVARLKPMARRVVESATLRGHDARARLRVFAVARGTKASQRIYDVYAGNAGSEHYPRGWARRRAVMQKRVRRLPDVLGRTQQSPPPPAPPRITLSTWA